MLSPPPIAPACGFSHGPLRYDLSAYLGTHVVVWTPSSTQPWSYHLGLCGDVDPFSVSGKCRGGAGPAFQVTSHQALCFRLGARGSRGPFEVLGEGSLGAQFSTADGDGGRSARVRLRCAATAAEPAVSEVQEGGRPVYLFDLQGPLFCPAQCHVNDTSGHLAGTVCGGNGECVGVPGGGAACACSDGFAGPACAPAAAAPATTAAGAAPLGGALSKAGGAALASAAGVAALAGLQRRRSGGAAHIAAPFPRARLFAGAGLLLLLLVLATESSLLAPLHAALPAAPPARAQDQLPPEDAVFAARLDAALAASPDPFDTMVWAWRTSRTWPTQFGQAARFWAAPPPAALAASLEPAALAALNATKLHGVSALMPRCLEGEECGYGSAVAGGVGLAAYKFGMGQQDEFYAEYGRAWKAITFAKAGVDASRHSQIVATGVIPIFRGVRSLPPPVLFAHPKPLYAFFEDQRGNGNVRHLAMMRHRALEWGHKHLTARKLVEYRVRAANFTAAALGLPPVPARTRVAFIDSSSQAAPIPGLDSICCGTDFLVVSTLIGLFEFFGPENVDVFYVPEYMFEDFVVPAGDPFWARFLYGYGFGFTNVLPRMSPAQRATSLEEKVARLHRGEYGYVVWGKFMACRQHLLDPATVAAYANQPHRLWLHNNNDQGGTTNDFVRSHNWGPWGSIRHNASVFISQYVMEERW